MKQTKCFWIPFLSYYIYFTVIILTKYYFIIQLLCYFYTVPAYKSSYSNINDGYGLFLPLRP